MLVLKLHRLGRISFRAVKTTRDYLRGRKTGSWLYLSRLAAAREFAALKALHDANFPVPRPLACNRHSVLMDRIDGIPLYKVNQVGDPATLYDDLSALAVRLAKCGVIHGDLNEFNVMLVEDKSYQSDYEKTLDFASSDQSNSNAKQVKPILIDFPQIISTSHPDAAEYFSRDINCLKRYFSSKLKFNIESHGPTLKDAIDDNTDDFEGQSYPKLDVVIEAAGFSLQKSKESDQLRNQCADFEQDSREEIEEEDEGAKTEVLSISDTIDEVNDHGVCHGTDFLGDNEILSDTCTSESKKGIQLAMTELRICEREQREYSMTSSMPQRGRRSRAFSRPSAKADKGWAI